MVRYRYSRRDEACADPVPADQAMEQLLPHVLEYGDVSKAMCQMLRHGFRGESGESRGGLDGLLDGLRALEEGILRRYDLGSVLNGLAETLRDIAEMEREEVRHRLAGLLQRSTVRENDRSLSERQQAKLLFRAERKLQHALAFLEGLPKAPSQMIRKLQRYDFTSDESRERFNILMRSIQRQVAESVFGGLPDEVAELGQDDIERLAEMLRDLNGVLEGGTGFGEFMDRHGASLGQDRPGSLEELQDSLAERWQLMNALRRSLSPKLRGEMDRAVEAALAHQGLREEMARFMANMRRAGALPDPLPFCGEEPLGLDEALHQIGRLHEIGRLSGQVHGAMESGRTDKIDRTLLEKVLGQQALDHVKRLDRVISSLEGTGYLEQGSDQLHLTPKGIRVLGESALREVFSSGGIVLGGHPSIMPGTGGDLLEETRPYTPGDYLDVDLQCSLANAMRHGVSLPLRLESDDLEVRLREQTSRAATVLLLDLSLSMAMRGNFPAAKKVAMALEALIRTRYPQDALRVIGFSTHAREIPLDRLPLLTWDEKDAFTNLQGALALARRLLARMSADSRQIILVSDGEPTAHTQGGDIVCSFPPSVQTLDETLREVRRCTRQDITVNVFMLDESVRLVKFVEQLAMVNQGRAFFTSPDKLGRYLLVDYVDGRRRLLV